MVACILLSNIFTTINPHSCCQKSLLVSLGPEMPVRHKCLIISLIKPNRIEQELATAKAKFKCILQWEGGHLFIYKELLFLNHKKLIVLASLAKKSSKPSFTSKFATSRTAYSIYTMDRKTSTQKNSECFKSDPLTIKLNEQRSMISFRVHYTHHSLELLTKKAKPTNPLHLNRAYLS